MIILGDGFSVIMIILSDGFSVIMIILSDGFSVNSKNYTIGASCFTSSLKRRNAKNIRIIKCVCIYSKLQRKNANEAFHI